MEHRQMKALTFSEFGTAEVLEYIDVELPEINEQEVLVEMRAIGLNYADIYRRKGNYHLKGTPPYIPGYEGAGVIVKSNSSKYKQGDRITFADVPFSNAQYVVVPEDHVIPIPDNMSFDTAASLPLQGLTAHYLATDSHSIQAGEIVVIHAAAGGVGQILTQICKLKGATVFGLTRDDEKLKVILNNGADHALILNDAWMNQVMNLTDNIGADVVYDSIGITLEDSFKVTKEGGHVVFFGMSGGDPSPVDPRMLMDTSKTLTGGDLWGYLTSARERITRSSQLFNWVTNGEIKLTEPKRFKLSDGKSAHKFLESGKSSGKVLMIPDEFF